MNNNNLLIELVRKKFLSDANELRGNSLYYSNDKMTAKELSKILRKPVSEIVSFFWQRGKEINPNQYLTEDLLKDYCHNFRIGLKKKIPMSFGEVIDKYLIEIDKNASLNPRRPIISIMGHIDHGKTTLLDTIRQTSIQKKEVGGITQKITVSQREFQGQKFTFLDTPGHSDFIRMRQRGISLTDLVVLVIDAKDGIMPQTSEIINFLHKYSLPTIIFINHKKLSETDNEANLNRIKNQLQENNLTPLEWGGETIIVSGSAREKESTDRLLENILLFTDYRANYQRPASGVVIDSYLHPQSGSMITELLVQGGQLKIKDSIFLNGQLGIAKILFDIHGNRVEKVVPGDLVKIIGLNFSAELGDKFLVINNKETKNSLEEELVNYQSQEKKIVSSTFTDKKNINFFLVADSQNALTALRSLVLKKSVPNLNFSVVYTATGNVNSLALELAKITNSTILFFGFQFPRQQEKLFRENNIPFFNSRIIYEIEKKLEEIIASHQEKKQVEKECGVAKVTKTFHFSRGNIAGCLVVNGKISRNNRVHVFQGKQANKVFTGEIKSLESKNESKLEVISGQECGIVLKGFDNFQEGDKIVAFQIVEENVSDN